LNRIVEQFIVYKYSTTIAEYINCKSITDSSNSIDLNTISAVSENFQSKQFYINIVYFRCKQYRYIYYKYRIQKIQFNQLNTAGEKLEN